MVEKLVKIELAIDDNVVFEDDSWQKIDAVLDWEMCILGDPFMHSAYSKMQ